MLVAPLLLTCVHSIPLCRGRVPGGGRPTARTQLVVAEQMVQLSGGQGRVVRS
jgi:hypothetical protein